MHIDDQTYTAKNGKTYRRVLLRNSYRQNGKIRHDTIASLTQCSDEEIEAIKFALKNKHRLADLSRSGSDLSTRQGQAVGAVWVLNCLARKLGLSKALGGSREGTLVLWLVMAALLDANSRLSAVRLAQRHAVGDILGLDSFNEDDLYGALDWLADRQRRIEKTLYRTRYGTTHPTLYLYDVTSTYLEGQHNALANFGYNRDGKKGKLQLVIGLLTDDKGWPLSIEVFEGNTNDHKTVAAQIQTLRTHFGVEKVVFVGDRGMIKSGQIDALKAADFYYISAISKSQIEALIGRDVLQLDLFADQLCEVTLKPEDDEARDSDGDHPPIKRYILRRNPQRAAEIEASRHSKLARLKAVVSDRNAYLSDHPKAWVSTALNACRDKARTLKIDSWVEIEKEGDRRVKLTVDASKKEAAARLDGCYVITSDVPTATASAETVHDRYKDLKEVEWAFRTMKTTLIEMRGVYVRTKAHTRAHVFTVMLAYQLAYDLRRAWAELDMTVKEGLDELATIDSVYVTLEGVEYQTVPHPREAGTALLAALDIALPDAIPHRHIKIEPRHKLKEHRRDTQSKTNNPADCVH